MVKKIALVCGVALAFSVLAVAVMVVSPGSSAKADSPFVVGNQTGAVVKNDFTCGILVPTGGAVLATDSHDGKNPCVPGRCGQSYRQGGESSKYPLHW